MSVLVIMLGMRFQMKRNGKGWWEEFVLPPVYTPGTSSLQVLLYTWFYCFCVVLFRKQLVE